MKVYVFLPARNEAENLPIFFESLFSQTLQPSQIVVINDGSTDKTREIAESYGVNVLTLPFHPESYVLKPELNWKLALVLNCALPPPKGYKYMMQISPDILLPPNYIEYITDKMEQDPKLVIAGGKIKGEPTHKTHVRGAGRIYNISFWNRYIQRFPHNYAYESYPLYKALALGFKVQSFPELEMTSVRPTGIYKVHYGYAMRELGYFPPYALARILLGIILNRKTGVKMLLSYLRSPFKKIDDEDIINWMKSYQINKIVHFWSNLRVWISRI